MLIFIVNPNAGRKKGSRIWKKVERFLVRRKIEYEWYMTVESGDAKKIAANLTSGISYGKKVVLVVIGGDGTINEVINGMHISDHVTLAVIPAGVSNDFARALKIRKNPIRALKNIVQSKGEVKIDYGIVSYGEGQHRRFVVSCGIGLDAAMVNIRAEKERQEQKKKHSLAYLLSAIAHIISSKTVGGCVILDDAKKMEFNHIAFVSMHIQPTECGGFRFAEKASAQDGLLSSCVMFSKKKLKLLRNLIAARMGKHLNYAGVRKYDNSDIKVLLQSPQYLHTDGEVHGKFQSIEVNCVSSKIRCIM